MPKTRRRRETRRRESEEGSRLTFKTTRFRLLLLKRFLFGMHYDLARKARQGRALSELLDLATVAVRAPDLAFDFAAATAGQREVESLERRQRRPELGDAGAVRLVQPADIERQVSVDRREEKICVAKVALALDSRVFAARDLFRQNGARVEQHAHREGADDRVVPVRAFVVLDLTPRRERLELGTGGLGAQKVDIAEVRQVGAKVQDRVEQDRQDVVERRDCLGGVNIGALRSGEERCRR